MNQRRALVTGAAGFVGGHLLSTLGNAGWALRALFHDAPPKIQIERVRVDLAKERDFAELVAGCDVVIHAAASLAPTASEAHSDAVKHRATLHLAQAAERAGARCFVFLSSIAALGSGAGAALLTPSSTPRPTTIYGRSKLRAEQALAGLDTKMRIVTLRLPTVFGPGEERSFLALTRAIDSGWFLIPGRGENRMSFCYIETLADAVLWALENDDARSIVHVADAPISFRTAVETIADVLGRRLPRIPFPLPLARLAAVATEAAFRPLGKTPPLSRKRLRTLTRDVVLDTSETERLGFVSRHDFRPSVETTVAWYRAKGLL